VWHLGNVLEKLNVCHINSHDLIDLIAKKSSNAKE
jgi:hypothetical protein